MSDPARQAFDRALAEVQKRVASASNGIVRCMCGGQPWQGERVRRYRAELERAIIERTVIEAAIIELDAVDGKVSP